KPAAPLQDLPSVELLFKQYYGLVCNTINQFLRDRSKTEDVAQDLFAELWQKREQLTIHTSVAAYLRRMAVTRALNYIRDNKKHNWDELDSSSDSPVQASVPPSGLMEIEESELSARIQKAITLLPEKCRIVFLMSRMEEMSYAEIAGSLGISTKTVENQIGKALKLIRKDIADHRG
ncbi:MAG TPA: RNA polymerase sigma-70 factor, partial [Saprospiraceae bacterium]|nr:RNA polymerase sigma-70 factor [Saprospiraceae bacterium]